MKTKISVDRRPKHGRMTALKVRGAAQVAFVRAMLNPPEPAAALRAAARRYEKLIKKASGRRSPR